MPVVNITTDKSQYAPGEQIVVTLTIEADATVTKSYEARGSVTIDGKSLSTYAPFNVVDASEVGVPTVSIYGAPGIALTPHPTLPNTWLGVAPNI